MAVRTRDDLLNVFRERMGETPSDSDLAFVEDLTDTFGDFENRLADSTDWKTKYEENDASWRKKYAERFYNPSSAEPGMNNPKEVVDDTTGIVGDYESLFKTDTGTWRR